MPKVRRTRVTDEISHCLLNGTSIAGFSGRRNGIGRIIFEIHRGIVPGGGDLSDQKRFSTRSSGGCNRRSSKVGHQKVNELLIGGSRTSTDQSSKVLSQFCPSVRTSEQECHQPLYRNHSRLQHCEPVRQSPLRDEYSHL